MDAVEFFKSQKRMCNFTDCNDCPLGVRNNGTDECCTELVINNPERAVSLVEEWAKEHPVKTRQSELLKLFPNALGISDVVNICPCRVDACVCCCSTTYEDCHDCKRKYWLKEIS